MTDRYPALFCAAGRPELLFEENDLTRTLARVGEFLVRQWGRPKAILAITSTWRTDAVTLDGAWDWRAHLAQAGLTSPSDATGALLNDPTLSMEERAVAGDLAASLLDVFPWVKTGELGLESAILPTYSALFPTMDIPLVPMSVVPLVGLRAHYEWGMALRALRDEGVLLLGLGALGENAPLVNPASETGLPAMEDFSAKLVEALAVRNDEAVIQYRDIETAPVGMPDEALILPLVTVLGASVAEPATVFNHRVTWDALAMSSALFSEHTFPHI